MLFGGELKADISSTSFLVYLRGFLILLSQSWVSRAHCAPAISFSQPFRLL